MLKLSGTTQDLSLSPAPGDDRKRAQCQITPSQIATKSFASSIQDCQIPQTKPDPLLQQRLKWKQTWKVPCAIIGFYLLSFACAMIHLCFFEYLDGRLVLEHDMPPAKTTGISQAYITATSLVIVTAFRAALLASVGTCYTQFLWATLRRQTLKVHVIEDLFQVQTNVSRLMSYRLYVQPRLFVLTAIAAFGWLVPVATIYPPGALIVVSQAVTYTANFTVPTFHWNSSQGLAAPRLNAIDCDGDDYNTMALQDAPLENRNCRHQDMVIPKSVSYITGSTLISGEIARLYQPSARNPSYSLSFWGTELDCKTQNLTLNHYIGAADLFLEKKTHDIDLVKLRGGNDPSFVFGASTVTYQYFALDYSTTLSYYPCITGSDTPRIGGIYILINVTQTTCRPKLVRYHVTISQTETAQHVSYSLSDAELIPDYSNQFNDFKGDFSLWCQLSDAISVYVDFANNLNKSHGLNMTIDPTFLREQSRPGDSYKLPNGTTVDTCNSLGHKVTVVNENAGYGIWYLSVFSRRMPGADGNDVYFRPLFDPEMAKELLINTTINALSLNERFDNVTGTETRDFNVYRFQHKLAFFLPYGLCLGLAIPMLALGLVALYVQNKGTSAISGGFLQILMTTTGRTVVEAVLGKGSGTLGGYENVSNELRETELRFGELVTDNETGPNTAKAREEYIEEDKIRNNTARTEKEEGAPVTLRAGFGTGDEVQPLRRRIAAAR